MKRASERTRGGGREGEGERERERGRGREGQREGERDEGEREMQAVLSNSVLPERPTTAAQGLLQQLRLLSVA